MAERAPHGTLYERRAQIIDRVQLSGVISERPQNLVRLLGSSDRVHYQSRTAPDLRYLSMPANSGLRPFTRPQPSNSHISDARRTAQFRASIFLCVSSSAFGFAPQSYSAT